jgi:methylmalonyl-CoA mutase
MWPKTKAAYAGDEYVVKIRDKEIRTAAHVDVAVRHEDPQGRAAAFEDDGEILRWQLRENVPGSFPSPPACSRSSARTRTRRGCSPAKATRSARTSASICSPTACRRSGSRTAFDSVTLYGNDPDRRPDIYGKVGNSGVSIATLDDMKVLYSGSTCAIPRRRCR